MSKLFTIVICIFNFLHVSAQVESKCDEIIIPKAEFTEEFGNPCLGVAIHNDLRKAIDKYGCPIKPPINITEKLVLSVTDAEKFYYDVNGKQFKNNTVIIEKKGWEYRFNGRKPLIIYSGPGGGRGMVTNELSNNKRDGKANDTNVDSNDELNTFNNELRILIELENDYISILKEYEQDIFKGYGLVGLKKTLNGSGYLI